MIPASWWMRWTASPGVIHRRLGDGFPMAAAVSKIAMQKVEDALQARGAATDAERTGRFVSVLCLATPEGETSFYARRGGRRAGLAAARVARLRL